MMAAYKRCKWLDGKNYNLGKPEVVDREKSVGDRIFIVKQLEFAMYESDELAYIHSIPECVIARMVRDMTSAHAFLEAEELILAHAFCVREEEARTRAVHEQQVVAAFLHEEGREPSPSLSCTPVSTASSSLEPICFDFSGSMPWSVRLPSVPRRGIRDNLRCLLPPYKSEEARMGIPMLVCPNGIYSDGPMHCFPLDATVAQILDWGMDHMEAIDPRRKVCFFLYNTVD